MGYKGFIVLPIKAGDIEPMPDDTEAVVARLYQQEQAATDFLKARGIDAMPEEAVELVRSLILRAWAKERTVIDNSIAPTREDNM